MFTSEGLHSELKHGGVRAPVIVVVVVVVIVVVVVVVVEGFIFLINIIVVPPEPWLPLVLCNCRQNQVSPLILPQ